MRTSIAAIAVVAALVAAVWASPPKPTGKRPTSAPAAGKAPAGKAGKERGKMEPIALAESDGGKTVKVEKGRRVRIRLAGNPTTGYSWFLLPIEGAAVKADGKVAYKAGAARPGMVGVGGSFELKLTAARTGRSVVRLEYKRPWEKVPALRKFSVTLVVGASAAPATAPAGKKTAKPPTTAPATAPAPAKGKQGIAGRVRKLTGNHMPSVGGPPSGKTQPLSVPVHVFKGAVKPFGKLAPGKPAPIATVRSAADGTYRIPLPQGEYTVVAEIDGKLYLNLYTGSGTSATVKVEKGKWATRNIDDTSGAAF